MRKITNWLGGNRAGCLTKRYLPQGLLADDRGAVAVWVGVALTVFIGCAGMAVDTARGYMVKGRLSQALDAAALAGAKSLGSANTEADIKMFFNANFPVGDLDAVVDGPHIAVDDLKNTVKVSANATIDSTLMAILGFKTITVGASATAVRGINALDVVISIDLSGSMCSPCTKIEAAEDAARILIDTLYNDPNDKQWQDPKTGIVWDLLHVGIVPWNAKVNVRTNRALNADNFDRTKTQEILLPANPVVYHPVTGAVLTKLYKTNISDVLFFDNPPVGWDGGVYARYIDNNNNTDDADLKLGYGKFGTKDWIAFEAIPPRQGEPVGATNDKYPNNNDYGPTWKNTYTNCYEAYYNDNVNEPNRPFKDSAPNDPLNVPDPVPLNWVKANPNQGAATGSGDDCTPSLTHGIFPLYTVKDTTTRDKVKSVINGFYNPPASKPQGNTNAVQGLYWAWEVLMPGAPFDQAKATTPFTRKQAIVLLTDGESTGNNGDAYKGVFGPNEGAGTTTVHGNLGNGKKNNLNERLKLLASTIKGADPDKGVKIYVVQYDEPGDNLEALLKSVATDDTKPYFFKAATSDQLKDAFHQIAADLSVLRLEK